MCADDAKYDLHVLLVCHGKQCASCGKTGRGAGGCPLAEFKRKSGGTKAKAKAAPARDSPPTTKKAKTAAGKGAEVKVEVKEEGGAEVKVEGGGGSVVKEEPRSPAAAAQEVKTEGDSQAAAPLRKRTRR
jgi:hypothetical protein